MYHWYTYFGLLGFKARVGSLIRIWQRCMCNMFPEIHLWCNTCQSVGGQHGSWAILFHIPVSRHWWGLKLGSIVLPLPHSVRQGRRSIHWAMPALLNGQKTFVLHNLYLSMLEACLLGPGHLKVNVRAIQFPIISRSNLKNVFSLCFQCFYDRCDICKWRRFNERDSC